MSEQEGITVGKSENFSEWYTQVVLKSGLADYAPIQGCIFFRELSIGIWENIQKLFNERIKKTGHKNAYFPLFIPESLLKKESEHFEGFIPECAWVTHGGDSKLEERLAIRPTSETVVYSAYKKWIRSWRDLPIKLNQWCNIVRWETKATKPFLRTREFLWQEGHTAHATEKEADKEVIDILKIYQEIIQTYLAIPVLVGKKSEGEKFAGALYTTTLEAMMPDGRALQAGTSHNLGQNFAKPFGLSFLGKDKKKHYVWTTSWGISTRLIGALVMVHGDDKGLVLPPKIAPEQVVIVPIYFNDRQRKQALKKIKVLKKRLEENSVSVVLDDRKEYTPGWKFNEWEMKGMPLRIEIGPKDIQGKQVTFVRRDTSERMVIKDRNVVKSVSLVLNQIQRNLFRRAKKFLNDNTTTARSFSEFKEALKKGGFIRASWCASKDCEEKIKEETTATVRAIPLKKERVFSKCVKCGKKAVEVAYFAKAY